MQELLDDLIEIENHPLTATYEVAVPALQREPDVYMPHTSTGRGVAEELFRNFGRETPRSNTSRPGAESESTLEESEFESANWRARTKISGW